MVKRLLQTAIEWVDGVLDTIPSYEEGRWYRNGGWGCRWHLSRFWDDDMATQWLEDHK